MNMCIWLRAVASSPVAAIILQEVTINEVTITTLAQKPSRSSPPSLAAMASREATKELMSMTVDPIQISVSPPPQKKRN